MNKDAILGWLGLLIIGGLAYLLLSDGPSPQSRERAAVREENARIACASGVQAACDQ